MQVNERARYDMFNGLVEVLGPDRAATMMELLPPVGWADVATKHDLLQLEERLDARFDGLEEHLSLRIEASEYRVKGYVDQRINDTFLISSRHTMIALVGSVVATGGLILGGLKLF